MQKYNFHSVITDACFFFRKQVGIFQSYSAVFRLTDFLISIYKPIMENRGFGLGMRFPNLPTFYDKQLSRNNGR